MVKDLNNTSQSELVMKQSCLSLATSIPRNITLAECTALGKPIINYKPKAAGTLAYSSLAREVIDYVNKKDI